MKNLLRPAIMLTLVSLELDSESVPVPPNWVGYFAVADCDASLDKAKGLGAQVFVPCTDIPGVGRFAVIGDPQGAAIAFIKLDNPEM